MLIKNSGVIINCMNHNSLNANLFSQIGNPMNGITQQPFTETMSLSTNIDSQTP
ncbi:Uncharacterised protein [Klebsiella pneumoniae]|uniref:Uncharacterized protein n=2 Tax=Klebsiella pneumoniae TaxID=573 RepID=A0A377YXY4_KLEPO|nr:Uncharacterised protein [Klebsiella pneumoniae]STU55020.1 Uncharacterised protein [Klebsiella pneumoniae subsp. ozaenae]VFS24677.1 Uncharacterised protein [Serratia liquefaciens]SPX55299.1 Uncharacterised protein [Klebsiella pneumoniae]SQC25005.1 Uncharacterised protein [Klebsiella pneumoniae]